jgi:hypothetical protein
VRAAALHAEQDACLIEQLEANLDRAAERAGGTATPTGCGRTVGARRLATRCRCDRGPAAWRAGGVPEWVRAGNAARTGPELAWLTADLPDRADAPGRAAAGRPDGLDRCLLCALLIACPPAGIAA